MYHKKRVSLCDKQQRIIIIGTSCSGKTTLAQQVSQQLAIKHVELDELHWLPGWQEREPAVFRQMVTDVVSGDSWVVDGNYSIVRDILWSRATRIIWLDYPLSTVLFHAVKRTVMRVTTRLPVCAGNVETFRQAFFSRDSIIWWVLKTYHKNRRKYPKLLASELAAHTEVVICKSRKDTKQFLHWSVNRWRAK